MSLPPRSKISPEALQRVLDEQKYLLAVTKARRARFEAQELCHIVLASALFDLKKVTGWTWEGIACNVVGISDKSHAFKIANRQSHVSPKAYQLITESINSIRTQLELDQISFPPFITTISIEGK